MTRDQVDNLERGMPTHSPTEWSRDSSRFVLLAWRDVGNPANIAVLRWLHNTRQIWRPFPGRYHLTMPEGPA